MARPAPDDREDIVGYSYDRLARATDGFHLALVSEFRRMANSVDGQGGAQEVVAVTSVFEVYGNPDGLFAAAGERFAALARTAAVERGRFTVALTGGTTPRPLFQLLARAPLRDRVPWDMTHVFWSDERPVSPGSPDSNFRMARETLLDNVPIPAGQVHRIEAELLPEEAAARYVRVLADALGGGGLDLVLLGMGADGHVASLFPGTNALFSEQRGAIACFVNQLQDWRITLSLPEINRARNVMFLVLNADKATALVDVRSGYSTLPAARVAPAAGTVTWLLDRATADALRDVDARLSMRDTPARSTDVEVMKREAGEAAGMLVASEMVVGLGTGSTTRYVVEAIGRRIRAGHLTGIEAVAHRRPPRQSRAPRVCHWSNWAAAHAST